MTGIRALQKQATRDRVLAAARGLFLERSFEEVGVREIAAEAVVATGTVIAAFGSKGDLLNAIVVDDLTIQHNAMLACVDDRQTTLERLFSLADIVAAHHRGQLPVLRASMADSWLRGPEAEARIREALLPIMKLVVATLERGVSRKEIATGLDLGLAAELIFDAVITGCRKAIYGDVPEQSLARAIRPRLQMVVGGLRPASAERAISTTAVEAA